MSSEPQRDIEKDLLAYKLRRGEQLGAPLELHPATRKMLQGEAARAASRPLLTSEEAAKNFVRSFVMSHQQPSFFARYRQRIIWGGAMCACLTLVLAVLRNDPRLASTPSQVSDPQTAKPQATVAATKQQTEGEQSARAKQPAPAADKVQELAKTSTAPVASPPPANPRGAAAASAPPLVRDLDIKLVEKKEASQPTQIAKALKAVQVADALSATEDKKSGEVMKLKRSAGDELLRANLAAAAGASGGAAIPPASAPSTASAAQLFGANSAPEASQVRQQFLQLDNQARYRKNFNSPPMPQVMQDFAFERTGDRVRIVDADGSTYEGTVMRAPVEEVRANAVSKLDAAKERKDSLAQPTQSADPQSSYRFYANGVNRKLNQSVEFRGEWQAAVPAQSSPTTPGLQPVALGVRLERKVAEKAEQTVLSNSLSGSAAKVLNYQQSQNAAAPGRISGRAVVGGKNEFDINAVPK
jgi:hypothetical protein